MNIKILAATIVLLGAGAMSAAQADDHGWHGGGGRGHWNQDRRDGGRDGEGWRGAGRDGRYGNDWHGGGRGHFEGHGYRDEDWRGRDWDHDRHEGWRREHWRHDYHPYWGYRSDYSYAPRYYAPYYYAPSYYAPRPWGGWFDDLGVVIQFNLP